MCISHEENLQIGESALNRQLVPANIQMTAG
jgi:hypothetical protein